MLYAAHAPSTPPYPHPTPTPSKVPRLCPPVSLLTPVIRGIEATLNVKHDANGRIAFTGITEVVQTILKRDCGTFDMPALSCYEGGVLKLPVVVQFDGTGFGSLSINTAVVRNPFLPQTSQKLYPLGVGKCKDDKVGTTQLLASNLPIMNDWIAKEHADKCTSFAVGVHGTDMVDVMPEVYMSTDVAALRHCEHMARSGWCGCDTDYALRTTPTKPASVADMKILCQRLARPSHLLHHSPAIARARFLESSLWTILLLLLLFSQHSLSKG